jgi:hypothetical protein
MRCVARRLAGDVRPEPQFAEKLTSLGTRRIFNSDHDMLREARSCFPLCCL